MNLLANARRLWRSWKFKRKYGCPYEDTWNLDVELAKWLAPRLRGLAVVTNGGPSGYGGYDKHKIDGDFLEWKISLHFHAIRLEKYVESANNIEQVEDHYVVYRDFKDSMKWVAEYVEHLWW